MNVVPTSGLSEEQIQQIIVEAEASAEDDLARKELADIRNQAESLLYSSERALAEFGNVLKPEDKAQLEQDLAECKQQVETGSVEDVRAAFARLEASAQKIGELIYAQAGS